jgi:hypothetical protein
MCVASAERLASSDLRSLGLGLPSVVCGCIPKEGIGSKKADWEGGGGGKGEGEGNNLFDFQVSCPGHQHDQALEHYTSVQVTAQVCDYLLLPILKTIDHDPKSKKENVE